MTTWCWTADRARLADLIEAGKVEVTGTNGARIRWYWHTRSPSYHRVSSPVAARRIDEFRRAGLIDTAAHSLWAWTDEGRRSYATLVEQRLRNATAPGPCEKSVSMPDERLAGLQQLSAEDAAAVRLGIRRRAAIPASSPIGRRRFPSAVARQALKRIERVANETGAAEQ